MTPDEQAEAARDQVLAELEAAADEDSKLERMKRETEAIHEFAAEFAEALAEGVNNSQTSPYAAIVSDAAKYHTKTDVQQEIQSAYEEAEAEDKITFDELVRQRLESVEVIRTTDHRQGATYRWEFVDCTIETQGGGGENRRGHFSWDNFRDTYLEASGNDAARPASDFRSGDDWRRFIVDMIEERGTSTTFEGPRTVAIRELANRIRNTNAYGSHADMVARDGAYVEIPSYEIPAWWGAENVKALPTSEPRSTPQNAVKEVHIPNHVATRVADNNEISVRALQVELNARGMVPSRMGGRVSETEWVDGNERTWWVLSPELAIPQVYIPSPNSAAEREQARQAANAEQNGHAPSEGGMQQVGDME